MTPITLQVLDGADRGRIFEHPGAPVTIGREEGNTFQLNDERVSRFHLKIQEDHEKVVLTDLASTNGTKVNGEDTQLRILRFGDLIAVGRSVLLFGSSEQIATRLKELQNSAGSSGGRTAAPDAANGSRAASLDFDLNDLGDGEARSLLDRLDPPDLPDRLAPAQAAQLCELLDYFHIRIRKLLSTVSADDDAQRVTLAADAWQSLLDLQFQLANYRRRVAEPNSRS